MLITSRPEYLTKEIKSRMDGEIVIKGFNESSIKSYITKRLIDKEKIEAMLEQAENTGIDEFLHVCMFYFLLFSKCRSNIASLHQEYAA